jgi:hypothetical protein
VGGYLNWEFRHTQTFASIALRDLRADGCDIDLIHSLHRSRRIVMGMRFEFHRVCSIPGAYFYLLPSGLRSLDVFARTPRHFHKSILFLPPLPNDILPILPPPKKNSPMSRPSGPTRSMPFPSCHFTSTGADYLDAAKQMTDSITNKTQELPTTRNAV